jgi:hypothetical protein
MKQVKQNGNMKGQDFVVSFDHTAGYIIAE